MNQSPLTQQSRPNAFKPKIVYLYESLFARSDDDGQSHDRSEGFWQELFLLRPNPSGFQQVLAALSPEDMIHVQTSSQQLLHEAVNRIKTGQSPSDGVALDTLTVFLGSVLSKKYMNPSSDIIIILTGLDNADGVFSEFVGVLDEVIRNGRSIQMRQKAVSTALALTSGAYHTGLITYFTHRDLFPSLMKLIQETDCASQIAEPFTLLGLLVNYNKFEFQNPYRVRLDDFVNDVAIRKIVQSIEHVCTSVRDQYIAVQDDLPEGWSFSSALDYVGLGTLTGKKSASPTLNNEEAKSLFNLLPSPHAGILLATYDFANSNKLFCSNLATLPSNSPRELSALSTFLSLTSYILQHAFRSQRASLYGYLCLFILQILIEDQVLAKQICTDDEKINVRLCRQRPPYLPTTRNERIAATVVLDIMVDGINHNLRRKLDIQLFTLCIGILLRLITVLSRSHFRLPYHWPELWRSLLSFIRFLTTYSADIATLTGAHQLVDDLVSLIALSLSAGESFLPDAASYDDLFYKLVEIGDTLAKFRDDYSFSRRPSSNSINILISVSSHYFELLESEKGNLRNKHLGPRQVSKIIKQGYDGLSISAREDLDHWSSFREADHKIVLKRIARVAVMDVQTLAGERDK